MKLNEIDMDEMQSMNKDYTTLLTRKNIKLASQNGIFRRYKYPVLTTGHAPVF